jgi:hypothetical protein
LVDCALWSNGAILSGVGVTAGSAVPDIQAPSVPGSPNFTNTTSSSTTLNWSASTDNVAVTGYRIDIATNNTFTNFVSGYNNKDVGNVLTSSITGLSSSTTYYGRVRAYDAAGNTSASSNTASATTQANGGTGTPVIWKNLVGASANGSTLTKTTADGWNSGAASTQTISGNGKVEFKAGQANKSLMCGLSETNPDAHYRTIKYALYAHNSGSLYIFEMGESKGIVGTYTTSDTLSVERTSGVIRYKKNGTLLYTSATQSNASLLVDCALWSSGAVLSGAGVATG